MRQAAFFSDNNFQKFPKIGSNNNYWIKLSSIIGNYRPRKTSRLRRKEETSLYMIILCSYLFSFVFSYFSKAAEGVILTPN